MSTEERLARALQEEADRVDVDLVGLHAAIASRTASRRTGGARTRRAAPVLVAALVLVVLAGVALLRFDGTGLDRGLPADAPREGGVDTEFSCPAQTTADEARREVDDALVLDLRDGPAEAARQVGAPRYSYREDGDRALLRLGNADGTLAASATFDRVDGRWVLGTTQRCGGRDNGISVPGTQDGRLARRDATPYPAEAFGLDPAAAVFVDDRSTYDQSGFARHRTVWADPCGRRVCVIGGVPDSYVIGELRPNVAPDNISSVLLDPDAMVGRRAPLTLWAVYDADGSVASVTAAHRDGSTRPAKAVRGPSWTGRLLLLLDDPDQVQRVMVRHTDGSTEEYLPDEIAD